MFSVLNESHSLILKLRETAFRGKVSRSVAFMSLNNSKQIRTYIWR